jgi:hypothetical protein
MVFVGSIGESRAEMPGDRYLLKLPFGIWGGNACR